MANIPITQLPNADPLTGTELVPIVQNGVTVRTTTQAISLSPSLNQTFLTVGLESTLPNSRYFSTDNSLTITDNGPQSFFRIGLTGAVADFNSIGNGFVVKTSPTSLLNRSIAVANAGLSITDGSGLSGNPTLSLSGLPLSLAQASGSGLLSLDSGSTLSPVAITGTAGQISVANGTGVGGNPTLSLDATGVVSGSYTLANITVDGYGRITSASNGSVVGTVSSVTVINANGFSGNVSDPTGNASITIETTVTGILQGNGTAISAATSGVDYAPATSGTSILYGDGSGGFSNVTVGSGLTFSGGTLSATGGGGSVTSVTASAPLSSSGGSTPNISITQSGVATDGYLSSTDWNTFNNKGNGTVTSVGLTAGTGISVSGSPITGSGSITVTNTAPDQIVTLTAGSNVTITGTYPSFTIAATGLATGDVVGPASATDNAIARFDGTTGKLIQNSSVTIADDGATVISVNTTADALRITQTGTGNAIRVEDSSNPDATPTVIDQNGRIIVGGATPYNADTVTPKIQVVTDTVFDGGFGGSSWSSDANTQITWFAKSKSGTIGTHSAVTSGDALMDIRSYGSDGSAFAQAARILTAVDGTVASNSVPSRITFSTTAVGGTSVTERMRIDSAGQVGIGTTSLTGYGLRVGKNITGATSAFGIQSNGAIQSDVTTGAFMFRTAPTTQNATFTLPTLAHYDAAQGAFGASSTVTNQYGFVANATLTGATNNFGFYGNIASGTGRWNFFANGTAANYFAGTTLIGNTTDRGGSLQLAGSTSAAATTQRITGFAFDSRLRLGRANAAETVVASGDSIGILAFDGYDGAAYLASAQISAAVDGTPGTNDMPGRLVFSTTADGASSPTERLRISSAGGWGLSGANYGTSGQVLTSNGNAPPTWTTVSSGSGTVTSITAGTGLTGGTITTSGTIALANTAVTPGSYTSADITVDAQGRITAASNGSGGGGGTSIGLVRVISTNCIFP